MFFTNRVKCDIMYHVREDKCAEMQEALAMLYKIKGTCGHEWNAQIYGDKQYREWREGVLKRSLCPVCEEERKAQEAIENAKKSKKMGLLELTGTERQVRWANELRLKVFDEIWELPTADDRGAWWRELMEKTWKYAKWKCKTGYDIDIKEYYADDEGKECNYERLYSDMVDALAEETKASYWIEHRTNSMELIMKEALDELLSKKKTEIPKDVLMEGLVIPEERRHEGRVIIDLVEERVEARYEKNDDFRNLVKGYKFYWDPDKKCWYREMSAITGSREDRAAELGQALLGNGFSVYFPDPEIKEKALNKSYEPEYHRWIVKFDENFQIVVLSEDEEAYHNARQLPGARWKSKVGIVVPAMHYKAVRNFAEVFEFHFTPAAEKLMTEQEEIERNAETTSIKANEKIQISSVDELKKILESSDTILEDLKDEE